MAREKATKQTKEAAVSLRKENPPKEKKIKPKFYVGTNITRLPKIPKKYLEDIDAIEPMSTEQMEKYLTAMALGLIPDRFGLEMSADTKLKALKTLDDLRETKLKEQAIQQEEELSNTAIDFVVKQKIQVDEDAEADLESDNLNEVGDM